MRVRGVGAVSLTWPHFGATVALTAGSGPTPAHSAGPDSHRSVSPYDLHRSFLVLRQNVASHNVYVTKRNCY
jgi:hypothetical protein